MTHSPLWQKVLGSEEKIEYEFSIGGRYTSLAMIFWGLLAAITGVGILLIPLVIFYFGFYLRRANAYALTNKRVLVHKGWLSTNTTSVDYTKITDVFVQEPFFDRLVTHTGNIAINTAGTDFHEIVLEHVDSPYDIKKKLDALKDKSR